VAPLMPIVGAVPFIVIMTLLILPPVHIIYLVMIAPNLTPQVVILLMT
jgi:hypothetical protein